MPEIKVEIKSCRDCPFFRRERYWTEDSWETAFNWFCDKSEGRKIQGYIDWHEESKVKIPEWCTALIKSE